jgi:hypothetical protein
VEGFPYSVAAGSAVADFLSIVRQANCVSLNKGMLMRQHVRSEKPIPSDVWLEFMRGVDSDITFHDHASAFQHPVLLPDRLQEILDDFGHQIWMARFAVRQGSSKGCGSTLITTIWSRHLARPPAMRVTS